MRDTTLTKRNFIAALLALAFAGPAFAQDTTFTLTLANNRFDKAELTVPANKKIVLVIKNTDKTPEEFESNDLRVEKVVAPGKEIRLTVGPLEPGSYVYFGDYHQDTAKGVLIAK